VCALKSPIKQACKSLSSSVFSSSPDNLFKLGFQDVDYQKLGLAEL
jgi:hypothetical protein